MSLIHDVQRYFSKIANDSKPAHERKAKQSKREALTHAHDWRSTMKNAASSLPAMHSDAVAVVDATGVSPRFPYHEMDVVVVEHNELNPERPQRTSAQQLSNRSSFNGNGTNTYERKQEREKRFACQFDPSLKNGRSLVRLAFTNAGLLPVVYSGLMSRCCCYVCVCRCCALMSRATRALRK